jgi:type II secretory pathway pseudopilin PulG
MARRRARPRPAARGLALLAVLLLVAVLATATLSVTQVWSLQMQREREAELLAIGAEMRAALQSYMRNTPNGPPQLPASLDDLLLDPRYPQPLRHLRRIYADPFTGAPDWELVRVGTGIAGLHSKAQEVPRKRSGFAPRDAGFATARWVSDWRFMVELPAGFANRNAAGATPAR